MAAVVPAGRPPRGRRRSAGVGDRPEPVGRGLEEREALAHRGRAARVPGGPRDAGHPAAADRDRRGRGHRRRAARRDVARPGAAGRRRDAGAGAAAGGRGGRGPGPLARARTRRTTPRRRGAGMAALRGASARPRSRPPSPDDGVVRARGAQGGRLAAAQPSLARRRRGGGGLDSLRSPAARHDPRSERDDGHAPVAERLGRGAVSLRARRRRPGLDRATRFAWRGSPTGRPACSSAARSPCSRAAPSSVRGWSIRCRPVRRRPCRSRSSARIAVDEDRKFDELGARLAKIENSELTIERDRVTQTKYRIRNGGDQQAKLLVKHPRIGGARLFAPPAGTEDNVGTGSALVPASIPRPRDRGARRRRAGDRAKAGRLVQPDRRRRHQGLSRRSPVGPRRRRAPVGGLGHARRRS